MSEVELMSLLWSGLSKGMLVSYVLAVVITQSKRREVGREKQICPSGIIQSSSAIKSLRLKSNCIG